MQKKKTKALLSHPKQSKATIKHKKNITQQITKPSIHQSLSKTKIVEINHSQAHKNNKKLQHTSKSNKKSTLRIQSKSEGKKKQMKLNLKERSRKHHQNTSKEKQTNKSNIIKYALPSFRQYCIIEGQFVPLQLSEEKRKMQQIFQQTACTSPNQSGFFSKNYHHNERSKRMKGIQDLSGCKSIETMEIGIQTLSKQMKNYSILVKAAQQEIGTQYSDRNILTSGRRNGGMHQDQILLLKSKKLQDREESEQGETNNETLFYQTMMKLENIKQSNESTLNSLTKQQKKHFREVFQSLIIRLQSPRDLGNRFDNGADINSLKGIESKGKIGLQDCQLEQLMFAREAKQMSEMPTIIRQDCEVDSSLLSILSFYSDLFCYVELHHQDTLVRSINRMYGWSYMDKFRFVSKISRSLTQETDAPQLIINEMKKRESGGYNIINESVFLDFMEEIMDNDGQQQSQNKNQYILFHSKCIFDCINELLRHYQPFYYTKGDPFPWSLSMLKCMTFYSIDKESLDTVISQVQDKITNEIVNQLCGIHVEGYEPSIDYKQLKASEAEKDIVYSNRMEREEKMVEEWGRNEDLSGSEMEIEITYLLFQVSNLLIECFLFQAAQEIKETFTHAK